jgi:hypothetical protein
MTRGILCSAHNMLSTQPAIERNGAHGRLTNLRDTPVADNNPRLASWVTEMAALCQARSHPLVRRLAAAV